MQRKQQSFGYRLSARRAEECRRRKIQNNSRKHAKGIHSPFVPEFGDEQELP
jgi:hypothetical protein